MAARSAPTTWLPKLVDISRLLVRLAETALAEADEEGRLPQLFQPRNVPLLRKELGIEATALVALSGEPDGASV